MSAKNTGLLLVTGAVLLSVLLFFAPRTQAAHSEDDGHDHAKKEVFSADNSVTIDVYANTASKNLEPSLKAKTDKWLLVQQFDSIINFWDKLKRPDIAAHFTEKIAVQTDSAKHWFKAGNRYYYAIQFTRDETESPLLYQCAMRCFSKGLKKDPQNLDGRIMLASCFVEGSGDPMKGISMLREIEKTDSNNVKLQMNFAMFSVKSGQLDKAESRFRKALRADSMFIEAYLHLADLYEQQGKTKETIVALENYSAKTADPTAKVEIDKYIEQLKKNNNN